MIERYQARMRDPSEDPWDLRIEISSYLLDLEYKAIVAGGYMTAKEAEQSKRRNMQRVIGYYNDMRLISDRVASARW